MKRTLSPICAFLFSLFCLTAASADPATWQQLRPLVSAAAPVAGTEQSDPPRSGPVVVTFFASWCPPCTDEFNHLNALASDPAFSDVRIVGINLYEDFGGKKNPVRMARFLDRTKPQFPLVVGTGRIGKAFGDVDRIPTVVVYGKSGREVWRFIHKRGAKKTHATLEDLTRAMALARDG